MKVGSLVVCVKGCRATPYHKPIKKGVIYTVRGIQDLPYLKGKGVILEEIINECTPNGEHDYSIKRFREVDTPTSISIEEILEEPVYA